jgi:hypothetical protein
MPRPLKRRPREENARFLKALARTGNARLAALVLGVHRSTYTKRRAKHPAFAAAWDAALRSADAALAQAEEQAAAAAARAASRSSRAKSGGEPPQLGDPVIVRSPSGRYQLRRGAAHRITPEAEEAFCRALSNSANRRWSAAQAGFAHSSFHRRARRSPLFAAATEHSLAIGWHRVLEAFYQAVDRLEGPKGPDDEADWAERIADCPLPPMTLEDAWHLLRRRSFAFQERSGYFVQCV